jgi:putative ABC transport system substrate-binding protein
MSQVLRRQFLIAAGALSIAPLVAIAQPSAGRVRRIGLFFGLAESDILGQSYVVAFRQRLQELGWTEGHNISIDYRWGTDDPARIRSYAAELVKLKPDVIVAQSGLVLPALQQETRTIPIVFTQITDPLTSGYVASLAHPGGNITGFAASEFAAAGKMVEVLKEVAPNIDRVTVILNLQQPPQVGMLQAIQAVAPSVHIRVTAAGVRDAVDVERAINTLAHASSAGLIVLPNPITNRHRDLIITLAARHRLPSIYRYRHFVASGGLVSYGERPEDSFRGAASYVDRILRGDKPGDLPVQQPTKFEMVINLKTAKTIGLRIPRAVISRADEVIE